jgi:phosphoribosylglycinamide formyltransferase-1
MNKVKIGILISGRGSNMVSIVEAVKRGDIPAEVSLVFSNVPEAPGLKKAKNLGIETASFTHKEFPSREDFDKAVSIELDKRGVDLVCLAGYMRMLSNEFVEHYKNRIMNIHPALLPSFPGLDAQKQAFDWGVKVTGCTVHFVDKELDHGPIILQETVPVAENDTADSLTERILEIEHRIYPKAVDLFCRGLLTVKDRKVVIGGYERTKR